MNWEEVCTVCGGEGFYYGIAPHTHSGKDGFFGNIQFAGELETDMCTFKPDKEDPKCGIYTCKKCKGSGKPK